MTPETGPSPRRTEVLLWLGVVAGVGLALWGVLEPPAPPSGELASAAAVVDGVPIPRERFEARIAELEREERGPRLDLEQRARILDELIAEELLLAQALRLDMPRANPIARKLVLESMVQLASALGEEGPPSDAELVAEYEANLQNLKLPHRYRVEALFFRDARGQAQERSDRAARKLSDGAAWSELPPLADPPVMPLPRGALEESELRTYIGPTAAAAVTKMRPGERRGPLRIAGGYLLVRLVKAVEPPVPSFEKVRAVLADRWRRKRKDERVRAYVERLRDQAEIHVDPAILEATGTAPDPATAGPTP